MHIRQNIDTMPDASIAKYQSAITRAVTINDNRGYRHVAGMHGLSQNLCKHHCEITNRGAAETDLRGPHPLAPAQKIVVATDAIKTLIARDGAVNDVSLVPIAIGTTPPDSDPTKAPEVLKYDNARLVTYD
jgi:hypothetical protein